MSDRTEFLQRSLADLEAEHDAGDLSDEDYEQLKARYTDALDREALSVVETEPARRRPNRRVQAAAWLLVVLLVAGVAGGLVARSSGQRVAGQPSSGSVDLGTTDKIDQARQLVQQGKILDAVKQYDAVLQAEPRNPVALAERGWLLRNAGLADKGLEYVDRAVAADPTYPEAHFFRAMILWKDKGDAAGAVVEFRLFMANTQSSADAAQVQPLLDQAQAEAGGAPAPPTTTVPNQ